MKFKAFGKEWNILPALQLIYGLLVIPALVWPLAIEYVGTGMIPWGMLYSGLVLTTSGWVGKILKLNDW